jgi:YD repeat-containing protein
MVSKTNSAGTRNYGWDFENRLTEVTLPGTGGTVSFEYNPFGRRIQKAFTQNGTTTTTNYVYDGDNTVETTDQNGNELAKYTQGLGIDEPLAQSAMGAVSY